MQSKTPDQINNLANRIYTTILHFSKEANVEDAWEVSQGIARSGLVVVAGLGLSVKESMELEEKLNFLITPRKSFGEIYNSYAERDKREALK